MWVDQVASKARWLEAKETSGDEGLPPVGSRVGEFSLTLYDPNYDAGDLKNICCDF